MHVPERVEQLLSTLGTCILLEDRNGLCRATEAQLWCSSLRGAAILSETGHGALHTACRPVGRDFTCEGSFSAEVGFGTEATSAARVSKELVV